MPTLYPIAHRLLGRVNISAPDEQPDMTPVTRVLYMDEEQSREGPWIVIDVLGWDPSTMTAEDKTAVRTLGWHYSDWRKVCEKFNLEDFDPSEWTGESNDGDCSSEH